jgi:hypothetical protein
MMHTGGARSRPAGFCKLAAAKKPGQFPDAGFPLHFSVRSMPFASVSSLLPRFGFIRRDTPSSCAFMAVAPRLRPSLTAILAAGYFRAMFCSLATSSGVQRFRTVALQVCCVKSNREELGSSNGQNNWETCRTLSQYGKAFVVLGFTSEGEEVGWNEPAAKGARNKKGPAQTFAQAGLPFRVSQRAGENTYLSWR